MQVNNSLLSRPSKSTGPAQSRRLVFDTAALRGSAWLLPDQSCASHFLSTPCLGSPSFPHRGAITFGLVEDRTLWLLLLRGEIQCLKSSDGMKRRIKGFLRSDYSHGPTQEFMHRRADDLHLVQTACLEATSKYPHGRIETQSRDGRPVERATHVITALFAQFGALMHRGSALKLSRRDPRPTGHTA